MHRKAAEQNRVQFARDLLASENDNDMSRLISSYVLERIPAIFNDNKGAWIDWKHRLASLLGVDPLSMVLVGGAALGFSPINDLHLFSPTSDIDVAIISPRYFDLAWHKLRSYNGYPAVMRTVLEEHRKRYIYWGAIATDLMLKCFDFGEVWESALKEMQAETVTRNRDVNVRIYRDPASLRTYQMVGMKKTQRELRERQKP